MFSKHKPYYHCILLSLFICANLNAQTGGLGGPLLNIDFGQAATDNLTITGPALSKGFTAVPYTNDFCPAPGSYTVVSGVNTNCFNKSWIQLIADNTALPDNNGYMMLINDISSSTAKTIFRDTIRESFCSQINYQFSAAVINVDDPNSGCNRFSSLTLQVEDNLGNVLGSTNTGDIQFAVYSFGYHFLKFKIDFMVPPNVKALVVKIIDNPKTSAVSCSNGIAIDDIQLRVTGPAVSIGFDATAIGDWVKSACYYDNRSFTMKGSIDPGYNNPAVQWQQSTDEGATWFDIPNATAYTYTQTFPVADTFLFRLRGSDASLISFSTCGVSSNLLKVEVNGNPGNFSASNNSPVCAGQQLDFTVSGGSGYEWFGPNGFYDNVFYSHIAHTKLADSGTYYVDIKTPGGCKIRDSTHVTIIGTDPSAGPDTAICKGRSVQLRSNDAVSHEWTPATGLSKNDIANPIATPTVNTTYTVLITDKNGCTGKASTKITLLNNAVVKAVIEGADNLCRYYDSALFKNNSTGELTLWQWNFGNGQTSALANPGIQYYSMANNENNFTVQLAVQDKVGCTDTAYHVLKVANNCFVAVATAFSPNGDNVNDYLYPLNAYKAKNLIFRIYNRNGQLVFESRDRTNKWDGRFNGNPQPAGTYVWVLNYTDPAGKKMILKGSTVLIR